MINNVFRKFLFFVLGGLLFLNPRPSFAASLSQCNTQTDQDKQAYAIYKSHYDKLVPDNKAMAVRPIDMAKKQQKGQITVQQYLQWRAQYEADLTGLALRRPPEVKITKFVQALDDQCVQRMEVPPVYKSKPGKPPCCKWFRYDRTKVTTYKASLRMIKVEYDFVIFKLDVSSLQDRIYKKLSSIFNFIPGGGAVEVVKAVKDGWDIGESVAKGENVDAVRGSVMATTIRALEKNGYKTGSKVLGPLNDLFDEAKKLVKQGKGVINAFSGQEGMVPGEVVYLGNYTYGMRVKGTKFVPEEAFWEINDTNIETKAKGIFYANLPCGLAPGNVGGNRHWAISPAAMCKNPKPPGPRPNPNPPVGGGGAGGGPKGGKGIEPHQVKVPRVVTSSGMKWPHFKDPCQEAAFKKCRFKEKKCRQFSDEKSKKEAERYQLARYLNGVANDYQHLLDLKKRNPDPSAGIKKKLEEELSKAKNQWQHDYKQYEYLERSIKWLEDKYQECLKSCLDVAQKTKPCPGEKPPEDIFSGEDGIDDLVRNLSPDDVGGGADVCESADLKETLSIHLGVKDPPGSVKLEGWYCTDTDLKKTIKDLVASVDEGFMIDLENGIERAVNWEFKFIKKGWPFKLAGMQESPVKDGLDAPPGGTEVYTFRFCYTRAELQTARDKIEQWIDLMSKGTLIEGEGVDKEIHIYVNQD